MRRTAARFLAPRFGGVPMGPADPILGLSTAYNADPSTEKVNLGVGVYRGDDGKPFVLESVKRAQSIILDKDHEYAPISGVPGFVKAAQKLAFECDGDLAPRTASTQSLSGTGALRVAGEFLSRFGVKKIAVPNPTWGNHMTVFKDAGMEVSKFTYYDAEKIAINMPKLLDDLKNLEEGTAVLLHACAHNPTGIDPTKEEWDQIAEVVAQKHLLPVVDMAYQGFASGDADRDAYALRLLSKKCPEVILCQSFAKSFGLYGQRCGAVHFLCHDNDTASKVLSQAKILIRPMYSNPPLFGARIVERVLGDNELETLWREELKQMANRMNGVRGTFVEEMKALGSSRDWSHITKQIGMMAYTGLEKADVLRLREEYHVYMTDDGRAAISGLNTGNVKYVAHAFHQVTK